MTRSRRVVLIQVASLAAFFAILVIAFGSILAENAVHTAPTRPSIALETGPPGDNVQIHAPDGAVLNAALFFPSGPHPNYAILLHGMDSTHVGMRRLIAMLLWNRYAVLAPDSRGHGTSSGSLVTYGVREAPDVHLWAEFLFRHYSVGNLYGLGESMGAAVLLQSLPLEPRFRAVVADSSFSTFDAIAHDRIYQNFGSEAIWIRSIAAPIVFSGLLYTRLRYGVDLSAASPLEAIRHTSIPILLIHGLRDRNIPPQHARTLLFANPRDIVPWFVPRAGHTGAFSADPALFEERVVSFFRSYER